MNLQLMLSLINKPAVLAALVCASLFVVLQMPAELPADLAYLRSGIDQGQWWRFYSGHFVHFTLHHALMNAAGLILVTIALLYRQSLVVFFSINVFLPLFISIGLWWIHPEIEQYRGYSGVIYGLISAGLILEWKANKALYTVAFVLLTAKIAYEQLPNFDVNYLITEIGVPVAIEAHLLGFLGGLIFACGRLCLVKPALPVAEGTGSTG